MILMLNSLFIGMGIGLFSLFGTFPSSNNYVLKSYSIGPGATNNASSTTYHAQASLGEQSNGSTSSTNYSANNGSIQTEQLNIPPAPTLSNGGNSFYNKLQCVINSGGNPSDTTYAIAVSTNNFVSTNYVQADGTLGPNALYQTITTWGGSNGLSIINLNPSTTYQVRVAAMQGLFTNTNYGATASIATVAPSITFSVSPSTTNLGTLYSGTVQTSSYNTVSFSTNAESGGAVYIEGSNQGLRSTLGNYLIPAISGNLASLSQGFGIQGINATEASGGPLIIDSPFNGTANNVGAETNSYTPIFTSVGPITNGIANTDAQAKISNSAPASNDYQEVLIFAASASF